MVKLVYIHGANATSSSFNYIREKLKHKNELVIEYSSKEKFEHNLARMQNQLSNHENMYFICHSLGGVYALHLSHLLGDKVKGAFTISTPYGGAEIADYAKYIMPFNQLLKDIGPKAHPIKSSESIVNTKPWVNLVTTHGSSALMLKPNDGVVTIASMKHRTDMQFEEIQSNHFEVVLMPETVTLLKKQLDSIW